MSRDLNSEKRWSCGNLGERYSRQQDWHMQRSWGGHSLLCLRNRKKANMPGKASGAWERSEKQAGARSGRAF